MKPIGAEKRVPIISRDPHPRLIELPPPTATRKEQISELIARNCPSKERSLLKAYRMLMP